MDGGSCLRHLTDPWHHSLLPILFTMPCSKTNSIYTRDSDPSACGVRVDLGLWALGDGEAGDEVMLSSLGAIAGKSPDPISSPAVCLCLSSLAVLAAMSLKPWARHLKLVAGRITVLYHRDGSKVGALLRSWEELSNRFVRRRVSLAHHRK